MPNLIFRFLSCSAMLWATACGPAPDSDAVVTKVVVVPAAAEGEETGQDPAGLADIELCDARDYRPLIGSNIAAATLPAGPRLRAFSVDDIVTQEYIPQRTNIVYRPDGTIIRVECG